ncbi:MAG: sensor domain-containing diguanylate cyclase [Kordiimonadaceae bacterium]|nr:sensor domain-containing diguanylate cyclase [Kordiimonadaceae bacterium]MBO6569900.1 sensor domain-containing diguanylate cyclase [Kordiimonadaceae bacterium]MBO6966004.1 sensor domain-containing diguanylate cyclase [Kordiimonadaceae bacterium]
MTKKILFGLLFTAVAVHLVILFLPNTLPFGSAITIAFLVAIALAAAFSKNEQSLTTTANDVWPIDANSLHDPIFVTDLNGNLMGANKACRDLLPESGGAMSVSDLLEPLHEQLVDRQQADEVLNAVLSAPDIKFSDRLNLEDGRIIERTTRPIEGTSERIWILCDLTQVILAGRDSAMHQTMLEEDAARTAELAEQLFHAKAELEEKQTELARLANTDPLSGLWNRRRFLSLGEEAIENATVDNTLWVLMMDIDHFKRINDTYGHAAGDVAIRDFANLIQQAVGEQGFVGRMGGEEFAAILTDCPVDEAYRIAERIRKNTTQMQTECESEVFRFTTSMGVAAWSAGETSIEPALDRADRALYSAKSYGRNRVVGYE